MEKNKIILLVILSFICGLLVGTGGSVIYYKQKKQNYKENFQRVFFHKLNHQLRLNSQQQKEFKIIIADMDSQLKVLRKEMCPQKQKIILGGLSKLESHVDNEQLIKLKKINVKLQKKMNKCN